VANNCSENTNIQRSRAARVGLGEPGSSSAIGCLEGEANKTKADEGRSVVLALSIQTLGKLAR
jgi:hypothetical protein